MSYIRKVMALLLILALLAGMTAFAAEGEGYTPMEPSKKLLQIMAYRSPSSAPME